MKKASIKRSRYLFNWFLASMLLGIDDTRETLVRDLRYTDLADNSWYDESETVVPFTMRKGGFGRFLSRMEVTAFME
jgi:hypothetical protein